MTSAKFIFIISFLISSLPLISKSEEIRKDSVLLHNLKEVEVNSTNINTPIKALNKGRIVWELANINQLPQILGNADPIKYSQSLPGISTNNEYDCGIHIYGCDNSHNHISIADVPIYNSSHILGLFSTFNTSHFPKFSINKVASESRFPNKLGGMISMQLPSEITDNLSTEINIGMISSQSTIKLPVGKKSMVAVSARACYINLLYGNALKFDESQLKYSFGDINATWLYKPDSNNSLTISSFMNTDNVILSNMNYLADLRLKWNNKMILAQWEHIFHETKKIKQTLYYTVYKNNFSISQEALNLDLPSSISDLGYIATFSKRSFNAGCSAILHNIKPQSPKITGSYNVTNQNKGENLFTQEYSVYADVLLPITSDLIANVGGRSSLYIDNNKKQFYSIAPSISLSLLKNRWDASFTTSMRHQYIYQTGFSSMGFPTEFWMSCNNDFKPLSSINCVTTFSYKLSPSYQISTELYYKYLKNVIEYNGNILDFIQSDYNLNNHLFQGDGYNYGFNIMLSKISGKLTGWLSYNYGRAFRRFNDFRLKGTFPANHERVHELNFLGTFNISSRWNVGASYIFASGTPFTAPEYFYIFSGNIITQYGEHNAYRLKPYSRFDISINYKIHSNNSNEYGFNLSIYNLFATKNELFWQWDIKDGNELSYKPLSIPLNIIPSLSFYIKL